MSVRVIAAEAGSSRDAALEKDAAQGRQKATAIAQQLPTSYVVKQDIGGVPQDVRRLTVSVYERSVESAIGRGLPDAATETIRGPSSVPYSPACSMTTRSSGSTSMDI